MCHVRSRWPCPSLLSCGLLTLPPTPQVITIGALIMELAAALVLGATVLTYDYFNSKDSGFF
jgi:hypothetical protein